MKVAILGAPHTGKTELTHALSVRLSIQGLAHEIVDSAPLKSISPLDVVLLCGLDLGHITPAQYEIDQSIRHALQQASIHFQVVYGDGLQRTENALYGISRQAQQCAKQLERPATAPRWNGPCDNCSDGECEHRLFTHLVKS
jgi:adenylate kinase family enzyme